MLGDSFDKRFFEMYNGKSCAVVGSAGAILQKDYGKIIDKHDFVIRCNQAPTTGYEKSVGSRTDIRVINSHYFTSLKCKKHPERFGENFISNVKKEFPDFDNNLLKKIKNEKLIIKSHVDQRIFQDVFEDIESRQNKILFLNPIYSNILSHVLGAQATNGFLSIMLGLKYFNKVSCFGFTFCKEMQTVDWDNLYYFMRAIPPDNWKKTDCHSNHNENLFVDYLVGNGMTNFYKC